MTGEERSRLYIEEDQIRLFIGNKNKQTNDWWRESGHDYILKTKEDQIRRLVKIGIDMC